MDTLDGGMTHIPSEMELNTLRCSHYRACNTKLVNYLFLDYSTILLHWNLDKHSYVCDLRLIWGNWNTGSKTLDKRTTKFSCLRNHYVGKICALCYGEIDKWPTNLKHILLQTFQKNLANGVLFLVTLCFSGVYVYHLRCYIYQARNLMALDKDSFSGDGEILNTLKHGRLAWLDCPSSGFVFCFVLISYEKTLFIEKLLWSILGLYLKKMIQSFLKELPAASGTVSEY